MSGTEDLSSMGGGALRQKLEETLEVNRQLGSEVASLRAGSFIGEKGYRFVKPEDLASVEDGKREEVAAKIEADRRGEALELSRSLLADKGLSAEDIDRLIGDAAEAGAVMPDAEAEKHQRMGSMRGLTGSPVVPQSQDTSNLDFEDAIAAGIKV